MGKQFAFYAATFVSAMSTILISDSALAIPGSITNLGTLGGGFSRAYGINNLGEVVGQSTNSGNEFHAFKHPGIGLGVMQDLGTLGGTTSIARSINNSSVIVGQAFTPGDARQVAFRFSGVGPMQDIGTLGGTTSDAFKINDAGDIVGKALTTGNAANHAFKLPGTGGEMQDLGALPGGGTSGATAINFAGVIVGDSNAPGVSTRAFRRSESPGSSLVDLGTLGGRDSAALDINASGTIVGSAHPFNSVVSHAFRQSNSPGSVMQDLGTLGGDFSHAQAINDAGYVVGWSNTAGGASQNSVLWRPDNTMIDLDAWIDSVNPLAGANWQLNSAFDINENGLIVGSGTYNDGPGGLSDGTRAYVLDASSLVPEPLFMGLFPAFYFSIARPARTTRLRHKLAQQAL